MAEIKEFCRVLYFFRLLVQIIKSDIPSPLINFNLGRLNIFDGIMAKDNW